MVRDVMPVIIDDLQDTDPGLSNVTTTYDLGWSSMAKGQGHENLQLNNSKIENGKRYDVVWN